MTIDPSAQQAIDQLLLEQGEYNPLELLLAEGRLDYSDYEAWRAGDIRCLEEALFGDPEQLEQLLTEAAVYAGALALQSEPVRYHRWDDPDGQPLIFSSHSSRDQQFHTLYRKAADQPQLDLFMDATASNLVNGITQALCDRNNDEAQRLIEQLFRVEPGHPRLGALEQMIEANERLNRPVSDPAQELSYLQQQLLPLADRELGRNSRNLLVPHWRRLTDVLQGMPFDPAHCQLHCSYTAMQALAWERVREAVEAESDWSQHPLLLRRHACACGHLRDPLAALQSWFRLCWQAADQAGVIANEADAGLRRAWQLFIAADPGLSNDQFPAWLLLLRPGLARRLPPPETDNSSPASYRLIHQLQHARPQSPPDSTEIARRSALKQHSAELFSHYMKLKIGD